MHTANAFRPAAALPTPASPASLRVGEPAEQRVCDFLLATAALTPDDHERARRLYAAPAGQAGAAPMALVTEPFTAFLLRLGLVAERELAQAWANVLGVRVIEPAHTQVAAQELPELPTRFLEQFQLVPLGKDPDGGLHLLVANPGDPYPLNALAYACGCSVRVSIGLRSDIQGLIERYYGQGRSAMGALVQGLHPDSALDDPRGGALNEDIEHLKDLASEAPVIRLVNLIIERAVEKRASDIHIEPFENRLKVRYRVDGVLYDTEAPPPRSTAAVISRIKIMARLDIAERRLPQDGRIMLRVQGKALDLRVATVPTSFGESVVMRLLDRASLSLDFGQLGFTGERMNRLQEVLARPHGIVLVTGPTGSGKTTTLYTALARLNTDQRKIITVEDPVEYQIEGINQIQVKPGIGLGFAAALRAIVRQDPDVIMIGEMRDLETCAIAIQSALTGHLVLSTLHTNNAAASIARLLDMGVEDYLLASTLNAILAQRLVRRLAPGASEAYEPVAEVIAQYQLERYTDARPIRLYRPRPGLAADQAYHGRSALSELLVVSDTLRSLLIRGADAAAFEQAACAEGMTTLFEDGLRQALAGVTTLEEVLRVTRGG